jgi:acylphosphatase
MGTRCIHAYVSGRVQGVFFRQSTRQQAQQLAITGSAINLPDGRVEVIACGEPEAVEQLIGYLHQGPPYASVTAVELQDIEVSPPHDFTTG